MQFQEDVNLFVLTLMVMHVQSIFLFDVYNANKYYSHI